MSGSKEGAQRARKTILEKYGPDYYRQLGAKGGRAKVPKGFAMSGKASEAGAISRRGPKVAP